MHDTAASVSCMLRPQVSTLEVREEVTINKVMILTTQSIQGLNTRGDYCGLGHEKGLVTTRADIESRRGLRPWGIYHWLSSHASIYNHCRSGAKHFE